MFFIDPRSYWHIILILSVLELLTVLCWGWVLQIITKQKYGKPTSYYHLFKCSDYNLHSNYDLLQYPQYSLVLVQFNLNRTIKSETFYTKLGDWICFEYENNQKSQSKSLMISSLILVAFNIPGLLMVIALNLLVFTDFWLGLGFAFLPEFSEVANVSVSISLWSTIISIFIKPMLYG